MDWWRNFVLHFKKSYNMDKHLMLIFSIFYLKNWMFYQTVAFYFLIEHCRCDKETDICYKSQTSKWIVWIHSQIKVSSCTCRHIAAWNTIMFLPVCITNVREHQRGQRNVQHRAHKTKEHTTHYVLDITIRKQT